MLRDKPDTKWLNLTLNLTKSGDVRKRIDTSFGYVRKLTCSAVNPVYYGS
jgi:hypothetical protein